MTEQRLEQLRKDLLELRELEAAERAGTATFRILELEDRLGEYIDILQELVEHQYEAERADD